MMELSTPHILFIVAGIFGLLVAQALLVFYFENAFRNNKKLNFSTMHINRNCVELFTPRGIVSFPLLNFSHSALVFQMDTVPDRMVLPKTMNLMLDIEDDEVEAMMGAKLVSMKTTAKKGVRVEIDFDHPLTEAAWRSFNEKSEDQGVNNHQYAA